MATSIGIDSGPLIPFSDAYCNCRHKKGQHTVHGNGPCSNCNCSGFRLHGSSTAQEAWDMANKTLSGEMCVTPGTTTPSHNSDERQEAVADNRGAAEIKPVIVGIEWHRFQGNGNLCTGIIGDGSEKICNRSRYHEVHSDYHEPDWMKDKHEIPDSGLKDSGERKLFDSGMIRDTATDKPRFDLVIPLGIPYKELMLTRWAELLRKGAIKYAERNWELADSDAEVNHALASAFRHFMQWFSGETDEDHAAAVFFNINEVETIRYKQKVKETG